MLSIAVTLALAATPAHASRQLWRVAAATDLLVLAGWAVPRAASLPDTSSSLGAWASMPGAACATLAAVGLVLAAVAMRPTARGLATAAALLLAIGPGAGALLVAVEPGPPGGEAAITADVHVHQHLTTGETDILFRPTKGNHYVTPITTPPNAPAVGVALVVAFAFTFVAGAIAHLRRRGAAPREAGMSQLRRIAICTLIAAGAAAVTAAPAGAHASLVTASPAARARVKVGPPRAVLVFSEPVQVASKASATAKMRAFRSISSARRPSG